MRNKDILISYYNVYYTPKLYCVRMCCSVYNFAVMYTHAQETEIQDFVDSFIKYFPFFVRNEDNLETIDLSNISEELEKQSRNSWKDNVLVPDREVNSSGVFGELFLDFYERIVCRKKLIITYGSKRSFQSNNETTGYDNVLYSFNEDGKIDLIICEAKFVQNASSAKSSLLEDINGNGKKSGHITKEYLDDYLSFIVQKNDYEDKEKQVLKPFFNDLNQVLNNGGKKFTDYLIEKNIHIKFVFFAIFQDKAITPENLIENYKEIKEQAENNIHSIGIKNFTIEIVFIPTFETSMNIKTAINTIYDKK